MKQEEVNFADEKEKNLRESDTSKLESQFSPANSQQKTQHLETWIVQQTLEMKIMRVAGALLTVVRMPEQPGHH